MSGSHCGTVIYVRCGGEVGDCLTMGVRKLTLRHPYYGIKLANAALRTVISATAMVPDVTTHFQMPPECQDCLVTTLVPTITIAPDLST